MEATTLNELIRFNLEGTYGETPAAPDMEGLILKNGPALNLAKTSYESQDVGQAERMQSHNIETGRRWTGELVADFTMSLFELFRIQVLRGVLVEASETGSTLSGLMDLDSTTDKIEFSETADFDLFKGAKLLKIENSANAENNNTFRVVSVGSNFLQLEDGALASDDDSTTTAAISISANYIRNGNEDAPGVHIERGFTDIGKYESFIGGILNSLAITIPAETEITMTASYIGQNVITGNASVAGTVTPAAGETPISAATVPGQIYANGVKIADLSSLDFTIGNNLRDKPVIGSSFGLRRGDGYTDITGSLEAYTGDNDLFDNYLAHGDLSLEIPIPGTDGRQAMVYLPRIKQNDNNKGAPSANSDVMQSVSWKAFRPADKDFTVQIDII